MFAKKLTHILMLALLLLTHNVLAAVILQYHHVSEKLPAVTSVSSDTFRAHLNYLKTEKFNVIPLDMMLKQLRSGTPLPPKTVAITFDDGYDNNITTAAPLLEEFGFAYTIFVNPQLIDEQKSYVMTWDQLRQLAKKGALIANHSAKHDYLHRLEPGETLAQWQQRINHDIRWSEQRINEEVGHNAKLLAYPYGEFNRDLQSLVAKLGFIGIGQHSGAVGVNSDFTRIPRFPASGIYSNLNTLTTKINSHAFAIKPFINTDSVTRNNQPTMQLTFSEKSFQTHQFACFISQVGAANINWESENIVTVSTPKPLPLGRSRYNCTAPVNGKKGQFYWFSQPWVVVN